MSRVARRRTLALTFAGATLLAPGGSLHAAPPTPPCQATPFRVAVSVNLVGVPTTGSTVQIKAVSQATRQLPGPAPCERETVPVTPFAWGRLTRPKRSRAALGGDPSSLTRTLHLDRTGGYAVRFTACPSGCTVSLPHGGRLSVPAQSRERWFWAYESIPTPISGASAACDEFPGVLLGVFDITKYHIPEPGWAWVGGRQSLVSASGRVSRSVVSHTDFPAVHDSHDQNTDVVVDPPFRGRLSDLNEPSVLEVEWEIGTIPSETSGDPPERTFPRWVWPSVGDRVWFNGNWIFDCGHGARIGSSIHYHTEIHPPRAVAVMRDQMHPLPGTGATPVRVTATDLYIYGHAGFVMDDLTCGQGVIVGTGSCSPEPSGARPTAGRPTAIDDDYDFDVCLPSKPAKDALLATSIEPGPRNTVGVNPVLTFHPAVGACWSPEAPTQLHVHVPLAHTGVTPEDVLARRIYAGWVYPSDGLRHLTMKLTRGVLHNTNEASGSCECSFFWLNVDRAPDEWFRLTPYARPGENSLAEWGSGTLDFSGPTFDFYLANVQDFILRTVAYDQDCLDRQFGRHVLGRKVGNALEPTSAAISLANCYVPTEGDDNDPYAPVAARNLPVGANVKATNPPDDFDLFFDIASLPVRTEDTADLGVSEACGGHLPRASGRRAFTCTILVRDTGPGLPRHVVLRDTLHTGVAASAYTLETPRFRFRDAAGSTPCEAPVSVAGGKEFRCDLGTVPVHGTAIVSYRITSTKAGTLANAAKVTTESTDPNPADNSG